MRFGISTYLFLDRRLERQHLAEIASHGFEAVELFATRSHFDYHDAAAIDRLAQWLQETGLVLHSIHAPIAESLTNGQWGPAFSNAAADTGRRQAAIREAETALQIARWIPFDVMVLHLGSPADKAGPGDNTRTAAFRSAEQTCGLAGALGVRVALEVIPNDLSTPAALVAMLVKMFEDGLEAPNAGICLDFGHAHLMGDVADAVETAAEHLITTHVHDNRRRTDDHLVPFLGSINWDMALMTMQKIGYDGTYMMELVNTGAPGAVLEEARRARERFERTLAHP